MPKGVYPRPSLEERFWKSVQKTDGCWLWMAARRKRKNRNYGVTHENHGKQLGAHVASWILHFGPVPDGFWVLHKCDNPPCVRPDHLFLGTCADNIHDMYSKGRGQIGESMHNAKLTEVQVRAIRARRANGERSVDLSKEYGVVRGAIYNVVNGVTWSWLH